MHFAHITNGIIDQIVVSNQLVIDSDLLGNSWIQTSYNTRGNVHYNPSNNNPDGGIAIRGNYAELGGIYNSNNNVFYSAQPYTSWTLDNYTWLWKAPIDYPTDGSDYIWDEVSQFWTKE